MKKAYFHLFFLFLTISVFSQENQFRRNHISWKMSDIMIQRASFEIMHLFGENGNTGIYIPISIHFGEYPHQTENNVIQEMADEFFREDESEFYTGLGMRIYPFGQHHVLSFYLSSELRIGRATYVRIVDYETNESTQNENPVYAKKKYNYGAFLISPGFRIPLSDSWIIGFQLSMGFRSKSGNGIDSILSPGVLFTYSF